MEGGLPGHGLLKYSLHERIVLPGGLRLPMGKTLVLQVTPTRAQSEKC